MTLDRDAAAGEALLTDLYLDALLAGVVLDAAVGGIPGDLAGRLDPAARRASERLRHDLVRVHPSFRFEERLATRLAAAAVAMRVPVAAGDGRVVAFRPGTPTDLDPGLVPPDAGALASNPASSPHPELARSREPRGSDADQAHRTANRPLLIGGALTSAALSLAGAAFVAWRLGRPGRATTPMARAARAVRDGRLAASIGSSARLADRASARSLD
jgi:hypothetical protein